LLNLINLGSHDSQSDSDDYLEEEKDQVKADLVAKNPPKKVEKPAEKPRNTGAGNSFNSILEQQLSRQMKETMSKRGSTIKKPDNEEDSKPKKKLGFLMEDPDSEDPEDDVPMQKSKTSSLQKPRGLLYGVEFLELEKPTINRRHSKRRPEKF
jgi:hypothetical protein